MEENSKGATMFEFIEAEGRTTLALRGSMTIQHAGAFREALTTWIGKDGELALRLAALEEIDLTGLQLICSLHRSLIHRDQALILEDGLPDHLRSFARKAGFDGAGGCQWIASKGCPWLQRDEP